MFQKLLLHKGRNVICLFNFPFVLRVSCYSKCLTIHRYEWFATNGPKVHYYGSMTPALQKYALLDGGCQLLPACNFSTSSDVPDEAQGSKPPEKKKSIFVRFKEMYRDYWYVLLPVHLLTSTVWATGFYYMIKSGVDVVSLFESLGAGERIMSVVKNSSSGHIALTYAMYKIATPARYAVTLGGTTVSINFLKKWGYIKPIPPTEKLKEMYNERKENFKDTLREKKDNFFKSYRKED